VDIAFWLELALFVILLVLSGFFSSSETAMFSLSSVQLEQMRRSGNSRIDLIERLLSEPRRLIVTILIGNEFVNVAASVISAAMVIQVLGAENKLFNLFIMVPILLVFGEITPKTLAIKNAEAFATVESRPIELFARGIAPIRWIVRIVSEWFTTLIVGKERSRGNIVTEDMVRTLAHEAVGEGALDKTEARFIDHIFECGSLTLEELHTPRVEISFIQVDTPVAEMLSIIRETRQSRFPIYGEHRDDIVGILYARDLINLDLDELDRDRKRFTRLLRRPYFVPETKPALELFDNFRERKRSLALTVDEYGGVTGLVTMEDLLECIFGDIPSPSDTTEEFPVEELGPNLYRLDGAFPLDRFNARFEARFLESEMETLGGMLLHEFGELPVEGTVIELEPFRFTIAAIDNNRIEQIQVERLVEEASKAAESNVAEAESEGGDA